MARPNLPMYRDIYDLENLYQASHNALKGKKSKHSAARFWVNEDRYIAQMHQELKEKCYKFGGYTSFILHDNGVQRRISVAPFRDRVLHHAIMQQIEPLFEKSFIYDSYANRKGKGYIRYVDDTLYFSNSKESLQNIVREIENFLLDYRLKIHPKKIKLYPTQRGFVFLGHKVFPTHFRLTSQAIRRGRKRLKKVRYGYKYGKMELPEAKNRIFGTIGFFQMGSNGKIMDELLTQTILRRFGRAKRQIQI